MSPHDDSASRGPGDPDAADHYPGQSNWENNGDPGDAQPEASSPF